MGRGGTPPALLLFRPCARSISAPGKPSFVRSEPSKRAILPLSVSWSCPARCNTPCSIRIFNSSATVCPRRRALSRAISSEMATSPAKSRVAKFDGNDSTSVGLSLWRNCRFSKRSSRLLVTKTFTVPLRPAARLARERNRANEVSLTPAMDFCRMIIVRGARQLPHLKEKWRAAWAALPNPILSSLFAAGSGHGVRGEARSHTPRG